MTGAVAVSWWEIALKGVHDGGRFYSALGQFASREIIDRDVTPRGLIERSIEARELLSLPGQIVVVKDDVSSVKHLIENVARWDI